MELHVYNTDLNKYTECGTGKQWMAWLFQKKKKSIRKIHFLNLKLACIWFYMPNAEMHLLTQFLKAIQDFF